MSSSASGSRGSRLSRAVAFFREAPYDEARVAFVLVQEAMAARKPGGSKPAAAPRPPAKRKPAPQPAPPRPSEPQPGPQQPLVHDAHDHQESLANA